MRPLLPFFLFAALLLEAQQHPGTLVKQTFEGDTEGWITMGTNGSVKVTHDTAAVKSGEGSLQYSYSLEGKGINTTILPTGAGKLAGMRRVRFWVKADHDTALGVILAEKKPGGGDYSAMFWAQKNVWQRVDLNLSDFGANDGPNDPADPNGKLDPEQVEALGIVDLAGFFNQLPAEAPMVVERTTGAHTLWIDDFEILSGDNPKTEKPGSAILPGGSVLIDAFDRGFSPWVTLGGMSVGISPGSDNPIGGPALMASIQPVEGKVVILTRRVNGADYTGCKRILFDIAAEHEGTFVVSIEVRKEGAASAEGPRYNFMIYPPEGRKVFRVNVSLADFDHDENSPEDSAGKLEAARIKTISIGDITSLTGGAAGAGNKIWIGRVELTR